MGKASCGTGAQPIAETREANRMARSQVLSRWEAPLFSVFQITPNFSDRRKTILFLLKRLFVSNSGSNYQFSFIVFSVTVPPDCIPMSPLQVVWGHGHIVGALKMCHLRLVGEARSQLRVFTAVPVCGFLEQCSHDNWASVGFLQKHLFQKKNSWQLGDPPSFCLFVSYLITLHNIFWLC